MNTQFNNNNQNQGFNNNQMNPQQGNYMNNQQQGFNPNIPQQGYQQPMQQQNFQQQPQQGYQQPMQNQGFTQPQQQGYQQPQNNIMDGAFTLETAGVPLNNYNNDANRNPDIQLIPSGLQFARICKIIDLGTQKSEYNGNVTLARQLRVVFEFPTYLQQFRLDDPNLKPSSHKEDLTMSNGEKSWLSKLIQAVEGRKFTQDELTTYDYRNLLGRMVMIDIKHNPSKKDGRIFVGVNSYSSLGALPIPPEFDNPQVYRNPQVLFFLGNQGANLGTENFANLYLNERRKIAESTEFADYINSGRIVFRNNNNTKDNFYPGENTISSGGNGGFTQQAPQQNFQQQPMQNQGYQQPMNNQQFQQPQQEVQHPFGGQPAQQDFQQQAFNQQQPQQGMNQMSPQMQQTTQQFQQAFGGVPQTQQFEQPQQTQQQPPQQDQGFGAFMGDTAKDDLPF